MVTRRRLAFAVALLLACAAAAVGTDADTTSDSEWTTEWTDAEVRSLALHSLQECGTHQLTVADRAIRQFVTATAKTLGVTGSGPGTGATAGGGGGRPAGGTSGIAPSSGMSSRRRHVLFIALASAQHFDPLYTFAVELATRHSDKFVVSIAADSVTQSWIRHPSLHVLVGGTDTPFSIARHTRIDTQPPPTAAAQAIADATAAASGSKSDRVQSSSGGGGGCLPPDSALRKRIHRKLPASPESDPFAAARTRLNAYRYRLRALSGAMPDWENEWLVGVANQTARVLIQTLGSLASKNLLPDVIVCDAHTYGAFTAAEAHGIPVVVNHPSLAGGLGVAHTAWTDWSTPMHVAAPAAATATAPASAVAGSDAGAAAAATFGSVRSAVTQFWYRAWADARDYYFSSFVLTPVVRAPYRLAPLRSVSDLWAGSVRRLVLLNTALGFEWSRRHALPALVQWTGPLLASDSGAVPAPPTPLAYATTGATATYDNVRAAIVTTATRAIDAETKFAAEFPSVPRPPLKPVKCAFVDLESGGDRHTVSLAFVRVLMHAFQLSDTRCVMWQISPELHALITRHAIAAEYDTNISFLFAESLPRALLFGPKRVWGAIPSAAADANAAATAAAAAAVPAVAAPARAPGVAMTLTEGAAPAPRIPSAHAAAGVAATEFDSEFDPIIDLVINACDTLTTQQALAHSIPVLCYPHSGDQFAVSARLITSRAGIVSEQPGLSALKCGLTDLRCDALNASYNASACAADIRAVRTPNRVAMTTGTRASRALATPAPSTYRSFASNAGSALRDGGGVNRALTLLIFAIEHRFDMHALHSFLSQNYPHTVEPAHGFEALFWCANAAWAAVLLVVACAIAGSLLRAVYRCCCVRAPKLKQS